MEGVNNNYKEDVVMKFNSYISGQCAEEETHGKGCGRFNEDIAGFVGKTVLKKVQNLL